MPAVDICEPQVVKALDKAGWDINENPAPIRLRGKSEYVFADLGLENRITGDRAIIVEVKCFSGRSFLSDFYTAVGQYLLYRNALQWKHRTEALYLALPSTAYRRIMRFAPMYLTLRNSDIKLIVVDLKREEIVSWMR